jgi:hypothetical protein
MLTLSHTNSARRLQLRAASHCEEPHPVLPLDNLLARESTLCLIAGLIPGFGLVFGFLAMLLGYAGYRRSQYYPKLGGGNHAWFCIIFGAFECTMNAVGMTLLFKGIQS